MFNTLLHFAIFAHQFKLGPCIVNRSCTVNAVLGCRILDFVLFTSDIIFLKKIVLSTSENFKTNKKETFIFFRTTILFLAPSYIKTVHCDGIWNDLELQKNNWKHSI